MNCAYPEAPRARASPLTPRVPERRTRTGVMRRDRSLAPPTRACWASSGLAGLLARVSSTEERLPTSCSLAVAQKLFDVDPYSGGAAPELHRVPFSAPRFQQRIGESPSWLCPLIVTFGCRRVKAGCVCRTPGRSASAHMMHPRSQWLNPFRSHDRKRRGPGATDTRTRACARRNRDDVVPSRHLNSPRNVVRR